MEIHKKVPQRGLYAQVASIGPSRGPPSPPPCLSFIDFNSRIETYCTLCHHIKFQFWLILIDVVVCSEKSLPT